MGCDVYANGDEIACKAGSGKVIAGFPDVCLTPPPPPAGPIPVPYPNTAFAKDTQEGSKTVMIEGQEVMLKDQSYYKTSPLGDEAATNGQGAGVVTHVITGKTYFTAWSMDVKFEDQNVDRHTDITTSNHASPMANRVVPTPNGAKMCVVKHDNQTCREDVRKGKKKRLTNAKRKLKQCDSAQPPTLPTGAAAIRAAKECWRLKCVLSAELRLLNLRQEIERECFNDRSLDTTPLTQKKRQGHDDAIAQTRVSITNTKAAIADPAGPC
jgi:hypothetical protein